MGNLSNWVTTNKIPFGIWVQNGVEWLTDHAAWFFDAISLGLGAVIFSILWILQSPPAFVIIIFATAVAYLIQRSVALSIFTFFGLLFIVNQGYWEETVQTLSLIFVSCIVCMGVGLPVGVLAARKPLFYTFLRPVLDLMQTVPTFVYLIPALILFGLGVVPGLIATVIFAIPAPIRLTYLGIISTPSQLLKAGQAFGASSLRLLWTVELPWALPQIKAGFTQTIMLSLSMVVIAALVGADGLGVPTLRALNQVNIAKGFEAGTAIVLIAVILDRFLKQTKQKG